ncbi:hypothetical protein Tco_0578856 [Tanacetum coccineum]
MCYQLFLGFLRAIHEQGVSRGALYRASPQLCGNFEHNVAAKESKRQPLATRPTGKVVLAVAATHSGGCNRDSILSLASVKLNQRLLLSSSRDGTVKMGLMDYMDKRYK